MLETIQPLPQSISQGAEGAASALLLTPLPKIYVLIPAYEAQKTLRSVLHRIPLSLMERLSKIVIVDDASKDGTSEIVLRAKEQYPKIELISNKTNLGYAGAQKLGFKKALQEGADILALLHADGQYAPELLHYLLRPLELQEADVVQGSRILGGKALEGGMPLYKYVANRALSKIENFVFGLNITEYHSGYMLYSRKALEKIPFEQLSNTFHIDGEMMIMAHKLGLRVQELPIPTRYADEKSHLKPIRYGFDVLGLILRYWMGKHFRLS